MVLTMLLIPWNLFAQEQNRPGPPPLSGLRIYVLQGNQAINYIPDGRATTPVVEVHDINELPVPNVAVEFHLPETGPGGDFPNGQHVLKTVTNISGQAQAPFTLRPLAGKFTIEVSAKIDTRFANAVIPQTNTMSMREASAVGKPSRHHWYKSWKFIVPVVAGVAVVAIVLATRGGSGGTAVVLSPGIPTYGAPH